MEAIASVYARSLFEAAPDAGTLAAVPEQVWQVAPALKDPHDLQVFFFSPYLSAEEKKEGLRKAITDAEPIVQNFLELLVENHRMPALFRIRREFDRLWAEENKLLEVSITSAVELDEDTVQNLGKQIEDQTGQQIDLTAKVDPDLIGGLQMQVGNMIYDATIRGRLDKLRREVARAA